MKPTPQQELATEESYLEHLQGRHNTTPRHLERISEQQEVVDNMKEIIKNTLESKD